MLAMDSPSRTVCVTCSTGSPTCGKEVAWPSASATRSPPEHASGGPEPRPASANQPLGQRRPHRACFRHGGAPSTTTGGGSLASPDRRRKPSDAPPSSWATFGKSLIAAAVASHGMCCAASRQPRASSASSCRRARTGLQLRRRGGRAHDYGMRVGGRTLQHDQPHMRPVRP